MPPVRGTGTADNPWPVSSSPPPPPSTQGRASSATQHSLASKRPMRKIKIFDSPPSPALRINKGPPSTIPRSLAGSSRSNVSSSASAAATQTTSLRLPLHLPPLPVLPPVPNDRELHAQAMAQSTRAPARPLWTAASASARPITTASRSPLPNTKAPAELSRLWVPMCQRRAQLGFVSVRNRAGTPLDPLGWREPRDEELTRTDLLVNGVAPTPRETNRSHQRCGICLHVKSHPVSYTCGHSHCYVCIRLWLEQRWVCPTCVTVMNIPPHRNYEEEAGIALDFPDWVDESVVEYSWEGLRFPRRQVIIAPDSD
ncbi:hypothetical protein B0H11DRAFT_2219375 [Mycena galericulata]|nr:hypothetical protein B0H11DRAFT_2219375 [Mycena galericulata]